MIPIVVPSMLIQRLAPGARKVLKLKSAEIYRVELREILQVPRKIERFYFPPTKCLTIDYDYVFSTLLVHGGQANGSCPNITSQVLKICGRDGIL